MVVGKFLIIFLINCIYANIDNFYDYVSNALNDTKTYRLPTNNEKLFSTCNATVYEYGDFDFIIVGGGAAGSVLANRLSEINKWKILLLEAGGPLTKFSDIPGFSDYLQYTDMNWGYYTSPQSTCCQGMVNQRCSYPRGKVIGGSSVINGAIYSRGSPADYDEWDHLGNPGWSYEKILPYFKKSEHVAFEPYDQGYHGTSGYLSVNKTSPRSILADAFVNANLEKGLKEIDYNGREEIGVSRIQFTLNHNIHHNGALAFLKPIIHSRKNLKILLNAAVNKLLFKSDDRVEGVTFVKNGKIFKAKAKIEVILSAGSINTPQLLLLSGIGPTDELKKLGISVRKNISAVGKNLQDHTFFLNLYFRTNVSAPNNTLKENLGKYLKGFTPLTNGANLEHVVFIGVNNRTNKFADIEMLSFIPPYSVPDNVTAFYNFNGKSAKIYKKYNRLTDLSILLVLLHPKSRGTVTLKSNRISDFPIINTNYFSDPNNEDLEVMYKGIQYALSLTETDSFKQINAVYISEQPGCEDLKSNDREYWYCAIRRMSTSIYHPAGTTKMGPSVTDSVVDTNCLVHNFENLRVVDGGVIPTIPRGHLNAPVIMIAEKISDVIKKDIRNCRFY